MFIRITVASIVHTNLIKKRLIQTRPSVGKKRLANFRINFLKNPLSANDLHSTSISQPAVDFARVKKIPIKSIQTKLN